MIKKKYQEGWWSFYNFAEEPFLDLRPLIKQEDFDLFLGRQEDIQDIQTYASGNGVKAILVTGIAGIGKTTFVCKAFWDSSCFIRVDLSSTSGINFADAEIAHTCVKYLKEKGLRGEDLNENLKMSISTTSGRGLSAGTSGTNIKSHYQQTKSQARDFIFQETISEALERICRSKRNIVMFLDETDHFFNESLDNLLILCRRIKNLLPEVAVLIVANRDDKKELSKAFENTQSLASTTFDNHLVVQSLWKPGKGNILDILIPRFTRGKPSKGYLFPLSKEACFWVDVLAEGNLRDIFRYSRDILMAGYRKKQSIPLSGQFTVNILLEKHPKFRIDDETDRAILKFLIKKSSSPSDKELLRTLKLGRLAIMKRLKPMEAAWLVERTRPNLKRRKEVYSVTQKGKTLIEYYKNSNK